MNWQEAAVMQGASAQEPDEEGQQYLERQRHAAAVQLHSMQLAIALLRAQTKMPRGRGLNVPPSVKRSIEVEPNSRDVLDVQPVLPGQHKGQVDRPVAITVNVFSTAADLKIDAQQPSAQHPSTAALSSKHTHPKPRPLVHRRPDPVAAQQFMQEVPADELAGGDLAEADLATSAAAAAPAPRILADPAHVNQQLGGWVRMAAPGPADEADVREAAGSMDEDMLGSGAEDEGDMMDEEEWV